MKLKFGSQKSLQVAAVFVSSISILGYSLITSAIIRSSIYFPLINHLAPVGEEYTPQILISEVLNNPSGQEPGQEWIEIYNRSSKFIDLGSHKIGDSETRGDPEGMYHFPAGSRLGPGQVIVIANQGLLFSQTYGFQPDYELLDSDPSVPDMFKYKDWAGGSINLNNSGDELLLLNQTDELIDAVSWGSSLFAFSPSTPVSKDGQSLERIPGNSDRNSAADWVAQPIPQPGKVNLNLPSPESSTTPTDLPPSCSLATLLITEVLYDPSNSTDPAGEWIEIFNWGDAPVELDCFLLGDEETVGGGEGMFTFPPQSSVQAGGVVVIANQAIDFLSIYGFSPDYELVESDPQIANMIKYISWASGSINLSNSGDDVLLSAIDQSPVDAVSWGNSTYSFSPSVPLVAAGRSIARVPADLDTNSAQDWMEEIDPQPGIVNLIPPPNHSSMPSATKKPTAIQPSPTRTPTRTRTPTATRTPTRTPTPDVNPIQELVINEIHAVPHSSLGDANSDGIVDSADDEFIEIVNNSQISIDISGWIIGDLLDYRHTFPPGTIVSPQCGVVVFAGGTPNGLFGNSVVQTASSGSLGLNNRGDIVYLYDSTMEVIISIAYGEEASDEQSITRDPDIIGGEPLRKHSLATGSNGALYSPGTRIDGSFFSGCSE